MGDLFSFFGNGLEVRLIGADDFFLSGQSIFVGRALGSVVAVDAVVVEPGLILLGLLGHPSDGFDVLHRCLELFRCAGRLHDDVMPEHIEGELHVLGPWPELVGDVLIEGELEAGVHLFPGKEHSIALVIFYDNGFVVFDIHPIDKSLDRKRSDLNQEFLLHRQDGSVVDHALPMDKAFQDVDPFFKDGNAGESFGQTHL